ncbi:MAG: signal recognition particle receptor subunit alpha, partial [Tetragenococcus halophilus]|nr:signal recognition particle receptor subunit alpha [Tetragenococcus halophilus]
MGLFDKIKHAFVKDKEEEKQTEDTTQETLEDEKTDESTETDAAKGSETEEEFEETTESTAFPVDEQEETEKIEEAPADTQKKYEKGLSKTRKTFKDRMNELFANFRSVDEDFFEEVENTLIGADVGFDTSMRIADELREEVKIKNAKKPAAVQNTIIEKLVDLYEEEGEMEVNELNEQQNDLSVFLFVGVNGTGKTTSIGKLAHQYRQAGKKVLLAAADTFRAGAIDQLVQWGERADVEVVRGNTGSDPASVVFDAMTRAKEEQADV